MASIAVERPLDRAAGVRRASSRTGLLLVVLALLWGLWEAVRALGIRYGWTWPFTVDATSMPHIHDMFKALFLRPNPTAPLLIVTLLKAAAFTAKEAALGFAMGAVGGFALGAGCELALACDFIYASSAAKFGQPEVNLGVIPGFGGTQRLARRVGLGVARELVYTGAIISAAEALRIGLVNAVVEPAELMPRVRAVAETIAAKAPVAIADAKRAMRLGADMPLATAHELERQLFAGLFATADQKEGMAAFIAKRPPKFEGR